MNDLIVAICDDEIRQINIIKEFLAHELTDMEYTVIEADSGERLLELCEEVMPDLVFLDIEMKDLNGIETGKVMRERNKDAVIAFVTGFRDFALQAFEIRAFDYIIKPLTKQKFGVFIRDAKRRLEEIKLRNEKDGSLIVKLKTEMISIGFDEILFIEKSGHQIIIHLKQDENVAYYGSFRELMPKLAKGSFVQCHQGYIVNINHVASYKERSLVIEGEAGVVPVSKSNVKSVKDAIERRLFG